MKECIINFEDNETVNEMQKRGYICHPVIKSACVSPPISCHSDVLYRKVNNKKIIVSSCQKENLPYLEQNKYEVEFIDNLKPGYATESYLNFVINEKYLIHNPKTSLFLPKEKRTEIIVKQGYTGCSVVCVDENAYITDDDGIFSALTSSGIDCLKIKKGNIQLKGYDYGFIGGASVKLSNSEILFFGDIPDRDEKRKVEEFLFRYDVKASFIAGKGLTDIGSALVL